MLGRLVTLETYLNAMQAHLVKNQLEAAGIRCVLADEFAATMYWHLSNAMGGIKLQVAEEDLERAEQILDELEQAHKSERAIETEPTVGVPALAGEVGPEVQPTEQLEAKPLDPEDEDEPPLNAREQMIERAYKAVLIGLVLFPVQFYATWLLASIWQEDQPIRPALLSKLRWTIGLNIPLLILAFLFWGLWMRSVVDGPAGI